MVHLKFKFIYAFIDNQYDPWYFSFNYRLQMLKQKKLKCYSILIYLGLFLEQ